MTIAPNINTSVVLKVGSCLQAWARGVLARERRDESPTSLFSASNGLRATTGRDGSRSKSPGSGSPSEESLDWLSIEVALGEYTDLVSAPTLRQSLVDRYVKGEELDDKRHGDVTEFFRYLVGVELRGGR